MAKKENEITVRSSAVEYLTFFDKYLIELEAELKSDN